MTPLEEYLALNAKKNGPIIITQREYKTNIIYQDPPSPEEEDESGVKKRKNHYGMMLFLLIGMLTILVYMCVNFLKGDFAPRTVLSQVDILAEGERKRKLTE